MRWTCAAAALAVLAGCPDRNRGISPVDAGLYFPAGIALDPRVPEDTAARWLFALSANSDLVFNSGTIAPIDLRGFFEAWMIDPDACFAGDALACRAGRPDGADGSGPVVGDVGAELTEDVRCRRNALKPQVVECEDTFFLREDAAVHVGNFGNSLRGWLANPEEPDPARRRTMLLAAVRGDPSVTYLNIAPGDPDDLPRLDCGQGEDSGVYDPRRCAGDHLIRRLRGDPDATRIAGEPSNILVTPGSPYALVTHASRPEITLIDLAGQYSAGKPAARGFAATTGGDSEGTTDGTAGTGTDGDAESSSGTGGDTGVVDFDGAGCNHGLCKNGKPAIVDIGAVFQLGDQAGGGWGLAQRPCFPGTDNVPALTLTIGPDGEPVECGRPLFYAGFRTSLAAARVFIGEPSPLGPYFDGAYLADLLAGFEARLDEIDELLAGDPPDSDDLIAEKAEQLRLKDLYERWLEDLGNGVFDQRCLTAAEIVDGQLGDDELSQPNTAGAFLCDARLFAAGLLRAAAFDSGAAGGLGDLAFSRDGNRLFAVQTNPGGLAYIDTSLNSSGHPRDENAGLVELCAQPTALALFSDASNDFAAVTCYAPGEVFIVDLGGLRVVANLLVGKGPHPMVVDRARQFLYIANTLDKTISVVDLGATRPTRFSEIARIGLQVPYTR